MILTEQARAVRKKAHKARLAAKGTKNYSTMYASQPAQLRKAAENAVKRQALIEAKRNEDSQAVEEAQGATEVFGGNISTKKVGAK